MGQSRLTVLSIVATVKPDKLTLVGTRELTLGEDMSLQSSESLSEAHSR